MTKYGPKLPDEKEILKRINEEVKKGRTINAFLLAHGFIEAYLLEILLYSGRINAKKISKKIIDDIERASFKNLLNINLILGNVSFELYNKIADFNKQRNDIVHGLIGIDTNNPKIEKKLKRQIKNAVEICKQLSCIYKRKIKEKTKYLQVSTNET